MERPCPTYKYRSPVMTRQGIRGYRRVSSRTVQIALGVLWIVDAALQAQPAMFTRSLANAVIAPNALNQPAPVASSITTAAAWVSHGVGTWNYAFVTIQLAIGIGLLVPRLVRPALIVMFGWCLGVWWFGEGFGGLLTGTATPLTGAPGAVFLYALVGMLVWPRRQAASPIRDGADAGLVGPASSALAQGPLGLGGALAVWSGFWFLSASLWLLPANRAADAVSSAVRGMAVGQPGWYGHFLSAVANGLSGHGVLAAWLLALMSLVIGLGPVVTRRPVWFLAAGALLQLAFWITGMAIGGILTGDATDPNIAPLVVLLAAGMLPTAVSDNAVSPLRALYGRHPSGVLAGVAAAGTVVVAAVGYPLVAEASPTSPAVRTLPTQTTAPFPSTSPVTTPDGAMAVLQFHPPTSFSCLAQYPSQAQVTIGWNIPSATRVTETFDGTMMHSGIRDALPFAVSAGVNLGTTLVFGCDSGVSHTIVLTWYGQGLSPTRRVVTVHKVAAS